MSKYCIFETVAGHCGIVVGPRGLLATYLPHKGRAKLERLIGQQHLGASEEPALMPNLVSAMRAYFEGRPARFAVRLDLSCLTDFRRRVLEACRRIPRGKTATYADLARAAGSPRATRAVGSAMANNPLPLVVPCHRVIRSDGSLGEFSSPRGVRQKEHMLRLEGAI